MASRTGGAGRRMAAGNAESDQPLGQTPPAPAQRREGAQSWECSKYDEQFYKTKLCMLWKNGCCRRRRCHFAHGEHELQKSPDLSKTAMCKAMQQSGVCEDATCKFAHDMSELRATGKFFKTTLCSFSRDGTCKMGDQCRHAHSKAELRSMEPTADTLPQADDLGSQSVAWQRAASTPAAMGRPPTIMEGATWQRSVTSPAPCGQMDGKFRSPVRLSELIAESIDSDFDSDDEDFGSSCDRMVSVPSVGAEPCRSPPAGPAQRHAAEIGQQIQNYQMWVQSMSMSMPPPQKHHNLAHQSPQQHAGVGRSPDSLGHVPWGRTVSVPAAFPQGGSCHFAVVAMPQAMPNFGGEVTWARSASVPAAFIGSATVGGAAGGWPQAFAPQGSAHYACVPAACGMGGGRNPFGTMLPPAEQARPLSMPPPQQPLMQQHFQPHEVMQQQTADLPPQPLMHSTMQPSEPAWQVLPPQQPPVTQPSAVSGVSAIMAMMQPSGRSDKVDSLIRDLQAKILEAAMPEMYED